MIHKFRTYEEASLFVSKMRSEGKFARILDDALGTMWGGAVIGSVRVVVGDETPEDDAPIEFDQDEKLFKENELDRFLRVLVGTLMIIGIASIVLCLPLVPVQTYIRIGSGALTVIWAGYVISLLYVKLGRDLFFRKWAYLLLIPIIVLGLLGLDWGW